MYLSVRVSAARGRAPGTWHPCIRTALTLLLAVAAASASPGRWPARRYHHEVWDAAVGLAAGQINTIAQTPDGYLWIGAGDGLYRFDGVGFRHFNRRNTPAFRDNDVTALVVDGEGLWIGTGVGGLLHYSKGVFRRYDSRDGLPDDHIVCLAIWEGKLWVGTHNGASSFDGARFKAVRPEMVTGHVLALASDSEGNLWIGMRKRVVRLAGRQATAFSLPDASELLLIHAGRRGGIWIASHERTYEHRDGKLARLEWPALAATEMQTALEDRRGGLWVVPSAGGLWRFEQDGAKARQWARLGKKATGENEPFTVLFEDQTGGLWAGTNEGRLHHFREQPFVTLGRRDGLSNDYIYSVYEDNEGVLWVGTPTGLNRIQEGRVSVFTTRHGLPHEHVNAIGGAAEGGLWIGTSGGVSRFEGGRVRRTYSVRDGLSSDSVRTVLEDRRGNLWVGTHRSGLDVLSGGQWRHYGMGSGLAGDSVRHIHEDTRGAIWVGTGRGLTRFDDQGAVVYADREALGHNSTPVLCEDERQSLWIGTPAGLARFRNGGFTTFGAEAGFTTEVTQTLYDGNGFLWTGSEEGIARLRRSDLEAFAAGKISNLPAQRFGIAEGLATLKCSVSTSPLSMRGRDGRLWFATTKGLATVDPVDTAPPPAPPRVSIERMLVNGREAAVQEGMQLAPGSRDLEFHYAAPSLTDAGKIRFRYKLEGLDSQWVNGETRRSAHYSNVGPGRFAFRIAASNSAGAWDDHGTTIAFSVAPHWHQTWWWYGLLGALGAMLLASGYLLRVRHVRRRERELARLVDERTRELQGAEARARNAWKAADEASRAKSEFLANMSHEFRTPMNGILGTTELLRSTSLAVEQEEYVAIIRASADSLLGLLNDVLDFSKIEAGRLEMAREPFHLRTTIEDTLRILSVPAHRKGLELVCDIGESAPAAVAGDAARLRQVIVNVVGNALKFTQRGEVTLRLEREGAATDSEAILHFQVADTGIGIPAERLEAIFDAFTQADNSVVRKHGGTGLGLTISRRLVEMMQGRIWVESEPGRGSIFHFTARMPVVDWPAPAGAAAEALQGASILIVDDNDASRRAMENMLRRRGAKVDTAESAAAALGRLEEAAAAGTPFTVALVDWDLAGTSGFELAEQVQNRPDFSEPKVIMLTSTAWEREEPERRRQSRVAAYFMKPVRERDLLEALAGPGELAAERSEPEAAPRGVEGGPKLRVLVAEDNAINQRVATRMLEMDGHEVRVVSNGKLAVEAIENERFDVVLMDLHMPEMDGLEAARLIRAGRRDLAERTRIVAMTAAAMSADRDRCLDAGMDGYIAKPISLRELRAALHSADGESRGAPVAPENQATPVVD
ncbi:MAG: response regulator [Bryobacteraceae bacterium]|nr:response regulator [Bryobacteraceae bacterium]